MWNTLIIEPMLNTLLGIYGLVWRDFGLAIIVFTILIRVLTYPLTAKQQASMQAMQELQNSKKWQEIQKKYKDDREKLSQEQLKLYQEMGINPFGSCLPTLIQFPIMIGLYQAIMRGLANTPIQLLELSRHIYPFLPNVSKLIPLNSHFLWMDLSEPERLNVFGVGIPVLAILIVITTYLQSRVMTPPSANPNDQGAQMTKMMNIYMPLMLGWFAFSFASGLALYIFVGNVLTILQYTLLGKADWRQLIPSIQRKK